MRYDDLEKLDQLRSRGVLSDEEFQREKQRILAAPESPAAGMRLAASTTPGQRYWGMDRTTYCTLLHLSQLAGILVPVIGLTLPIAMWASYKDRDALIDAHGRVVASWVASSLIYAAGAFLLSFLLIGIPLLIALFGCCVVFAVIGAVRASNGVVWKYPLSIPFFRSPGGIVAA